MEVERRREVRKITTARSLLETDRLQRLRTLSTVVHSWASLDLSAKDSAIEGLRDLVQGSKPTPTLPHYVDGLLQLPQEEFSHTTDPLGRGGAGEAYHEVYGEFSGDELAQLLKRAGVPVSGSGELDPDVFDVDADANTPGLPPPPFDLEVPVADVIDDLSSLQSLPLDDATSEEISDLVSEADIPIALSPQEEPPAHAETPAARADIEAIRSTLANLYIEYKANRERFDSLPQPTPTKQPADDPTAIETKTEYMMSKTQHQLTIEEGAFWTKLADLKSLEEELEDAATMLGQKSAVLSESYSRRTHPPTTQTYEESKELIWAMGVPCLEPDGPFEAEALAASIVLHGQADLVASEDTDVLVYGAPLVRNIAKRSDPLVVMSGPEVRTALELDQKRFIDFALLLGTDFSQRIKNVGPARALKFIRQHGSIEQVLERETQYPPRIPTSLYLQQVDVARVVFHTLPPVPDDFYLRMGVPDDAAVQEILQKYGLWKEVSHDYEWDYTRALSGNYFDDNPASA
ncbi:PIN domain-like protein [Phanerochaete sordida]|uniref:PIN domain-like protein n=1 Tax=Phanerochaete sordida TaxID=48140 RepID=A0A9P3GJP4_9APHY|nr:PIN domain-like protein [Phanerochaete sordida]